VYYKVFKGDWFQTENFLNKLAVYDIEFEIVAQELNNMNEELLTTIKIYDEYTIKFIEIELNEMKKDLQQLLITYENMKANIKLMENEINEIQQIIKSLKGENDVNNV